MSFLNCDLSLLTKREMNKIHFAALDILENTGVKVESERMLRLLEPQGAKIDYNNMIARFSSNTIEKNIEKAVYDAKNDPTFLNAGIDDRKFRLYTAGTCAYVLDMKSDKIRLATKQDHKQAVIVADFLESVDKVGGLFYPRDVPPQTDDIHAWEIILINTSKPGSVLVMNKSSVKFIYEMCQVANYKDFSYGCFPSCPLIFPKYAMDIAFEFIDMNLPVHYGGSMVIAGLSSPITLAGSLVQGLAESMSCLMLAHATGMPGNIAFVPAVADQQTMVACYASPEKILMTIASRISLLKYYGFPLGRIVHVMKSDANSVNEQSGAERMASALLASLAGARGGYGGELSQELGSIPQLILDDEICSFITRLLEGITVNDDTLAVDLIKSIGIGGTHMTSDKALDYTHEHMRSEMWIPKIFDRRRAETFNPDKHEPYKKAKLKVNQILQDHDPHPLSEAQEKEISLIREKADKLYAR